jgi:hypothetical protein
MPGQRDRASYRHATDTFGRHLRPILRRRLPIVLGLAARRCAYTPLRARLSGAKGESASLRTRRRDGLDIA